jgi:L-fucose mutarotase
MGHGDTIVLADGNFPSESIGKAAIVIRADGHGIPELLDAILQLFPLDTYVDQPVALMKVVPGDTVQTPIWEDYGQLLKLHDLRGDAAIRTVERFDFYEEAKKAYAIVATGESALYANILLQKGVI